MMKGIYTPLSGAMTQERVLEIISNNLANLNTNSFKGENVSFTVLEPEPKENYKTPFPPANYKFDIGNMMPLRGNEMHYVGISEVKRDDSQGPVIQTDTPTNMMISGKGYFSVMTDEGVRYTRDGAFTLNRDGVLTNHDGHSVLGERGNIYLRSGQFEVNPRGEIYQDKQLVDRLLVFDAADPKSMERSGNNQYFFNGPPSELTKMETQDIRQGMLEGSNVNAIKGMTAMIIAHRSYEAYQKAVSNYDSMLDKSANRIGEVQA